VSHPSPDLPGPLPAGAEDPPVRAQPDRPRGLDAEFAPGGEDEATPERRADERRLRRLLLVMLALLVGVPGLLTIAAFVGQLLALRGVS
jgi:hypothetical protein